MTQEQRVLTYMKGHKGITQLNAIYDLGITRLSGRIFELRRKGYVIETEFKKGLNRFGEETRYGCYRLISEPEEAQG